MPECPKCREQMRKEHRRYFQRLVFSAIFVCRKCEFRAPRYRRFWFSAYFFVFSRYTLCVRCGTFRVHRLSKRDPIDQVSRHPLSLVQQLFGAPKNKCPYCRLQYHDLRPVAPSVAHSKG